MRRRRREGLRGGLGLVLEDPLKGGREEPGRRENIGAALAFKEESEPERERRAMRWPERLGWALNKKLSVLGSGGGE